VAVATTFSFITDTTISILGSTTYRPQAIERQLADQVCAISPQGQPHAWQITSNGALYTFWTNTQLFHYLSLQLRTWRNSGYHALVTAYLQQCCGSWTHKTANWGSRSPRTALPPKPYPTLPTLGLWYHRTSRRGGGASMHDPNETRDTTMISLCLRSIHTEPQFYWEPQYELNCLAHAHNMLRGEKLPTPDGLHSHTCNKLQLDDTYLHLVSLDPTDLREEGGNFSFHCLNHDCLRSQN
jgi:hypothetical protein